jgi:hypothetical protein
MRFMRFSLCMTLAITAVCVTAYGADITILGTRAAFNGETSGVTTITFEGITATNAAQNFLNPGLVTSGVTFSTSGTGPFGSGFVTVYGAALAGMQSSVLNTGTGAILVWGPPNQPGTVFLNATLPAGVTAVGTDFWAQQPFISPVNVTVNAADATSQTFTINTVNRPTSSFVGFTSDTAITSLSFQTIQGQTGLVVDNFSYGQSLDSPPVSQVPETPSIVLLVFGLGGIVLLSHAAFVRHRINAE